MVKELEINKDTEELIIEVYGEGQDCNQQMGLSNISINNLIKDHLYQGDDSQIHTVLREDFGCDET